MLHPTSVVFFLSLLILIFFVCVMAKRDVFHSLKYRLEEELQPSESVHKIAHDSAPDDGKIETSTRL